MSDFHEEFEGRAAGSPRSTVGDDAVAAEPESAPSPEVETSDVDAGGAGPGASPADPAAPRSELAEEFAVAATSEDTANASADVDADLGELTARAAKADEYLQLAQRTRADFDNYRKRAARDNALAGERGTAKLAKELLPALDNLERAIAHAQADDPLLEGINFVYSDLLAALNRAGIEAFSPAGEAFDPQLHEAVAQHPVEGAEAGTVLEVYQQGYRLAETVLRPARVLVAA